MSKTDPEVSQTDLDGSEAAAPSVPEGFSVHNASSANWVVRKIIDAQRYSTDVRAWAVAETRRAENEGRFFLQRFGQQLESWAREYLRISNGNRRSIHLPAGTIGFRASAPHLVVVDETKLLSWCHEHLPRAVSVEVRVTGSDAERLLEWIRRNCPTSDVDECTIKSFVDEHFRATGERPAGTECVTGEKFFVR